MKKLTEQQVRRYSRVIDSRLNEFLDGYALMGFFAGSNEPLILVRCCDKKTQMALNTLVASQLGQIGIVPPDDFDAERAR